MGKGSQKDTMINFFEEVSARLPRLGVVTVRFPNQEGQPGDMPWRGEDLGIPRLSEEEGGQKINQAADWL